MIYKGNIVKWDNELWVVESYDVDARESTLISMSTTNMTAHPSDTWPESDANQFNSIEFIADTMKGYLMERLTDMMGFDI